MRMFKTKFCWWPVRLARHVEQKHNYDPSMEFIGWVWMQRAHLTNNVNHGWVAFLDSTPMPKRCPECGQELPSNAELRGGPAVSSPERPA